MTRMYSINVKNVTMYERYPPLRSPVVTSPEGFLLGRVTRCGGLSGEERCRVLAYSPES